MSQNAAPPVKGPAPPVEVMTMAKRAKRLWTLLTTEEVFNAADGTSKRVTRVHRAIRG
jgi:hypothetical protein